MSNIRSLTIEEVDLDVVWYIFSKGNSYIVVDGQAISTYDDFVRFYNSEPNKNRSLTLKVVPIIDGG